MRLAIKDVKRRMWDQQWAGWRTRVEAQKRADQEALASGNRGFMVRNGTSTLVGRPKLQLHVHQPETQ